MSLEKITEKITLPVAIVIAAIVLAIGLFAVQYNKQQSIERQQVLKLQEEKLREEVRAEQEQKEYIAERKRDCLAIYEAESDKWNNVQGWNYREPLTTTSELEKLALIRHNNDTCEIIYKDTTGENFSKYY